MTDGDRRQEVRGARVYLRVSTDEQDLARQEEIVTGARAVGYYVAAVHREKASGTGADRPELLRMIADLRSGEVVVAEKVDRISRLPLAVGAGRQRGRGAHRAGGGAGDAAARRAPDRARRPWGPARAAAAGDRDREAGRRYTGRKADTAQHRRIVALREAGMSIAKTADLTPCSPARVKRVMALHRAKVAAPT